MPNHVALDMADVEVDPSVYTNVYLMGGDIGNLILEKKRLVFSRSDAMDKRTWDLSSIRVDPVSSNANSVVLESQKSSKQTRILFVLGTTAAAERLIRDLESRQGLIVVEASEETFPSSISYTVEEIPPDELMEEAPQPLAQLLPRAGSIISAKLEDQDCYMRRKLGDTSKTSMKDTSRASLSDFSIYDGDEDASENPELTAALTEDTYSLLFVSEPWGQAFFYAIFSSITQCTILFLLLLDLIDISDDPPTMANGKENRLNIPVGVPIAVTVSQFAGIFVSVTFLLDNGDLMKGCEHLWNGYSKSFRKVAPHASFPKWLLSGLLQSFVGLQLTIILFVLMMQSTNVLGFCLNFAALMFIQEIDDAAFSVASQGLVSRKVQAECLGVGRIMIPTEYKHGNRNYYLRKLLIFILTTSLYAGFFLVWSWQASGVYGCSSVYVQFGDDFAPELSYYSGKFTSERNWAGRPTFVHETGEMKLVYSSSDSAWVFKWTEEPDIPEDSPYANYIRGSYLVRSSETDTFDVATVADQTWYAHMQAGDLPMDWLALTCADCNPGRCWPEHGKCVDNVCQCNEGQLGLNCEMAAPECGYYGLDYRTKGNLPDLRGGSAFLSNEFWMMEGIRIFERNFFVHFDKPVFIIFAGRRWIMFGTLGDIETDNQLRISFTQPEILDELRNMTSLDSLRAIQSFSHLTPLYFSSPMDYGTSSNGVDFTSLTWFVAKEDKASTTRSNPEAILGYSSSVFGYMPDQEYPITAKFLCTQCFKDEDCHNDGKCNHIDDGSCQCPMFFNGFMCEQVRSCHEVGCFNEGVCEQATGLCTQCTPGSDGNLCQYPAPKEIEDPHFCATTNYDTDGWVDRNGNSWPYRGECANEQACNPFTQQCECKPPFYGEGCVYSTQTPCLKFYNITYDTELMKEWEDPCLNGGYCDFDRYKENPICVCPVQFSGDFCERPLKNHSLLPALQERTIPAVPHPPSVRKSIPRNSPHRRSGGHD